jgi:integrase
MSVFKIGKVYHYDFVFEGKRYKKSTGKTTKAAAEAVEAKEKERLKKPFEQILEEEAREHERKTVAAAADAYLEDYKVKHPNSTTFAEYALRPVKRILGAKLILEITDGVAQKYQTDRLAEKVAPKSINDEVGLLLRVCGDHGDIVRTRLKRKKALKLKVDPSPGKPFSVEEQERMLAVALASTQAARLACQRQARGGKSQDGVKQGGSPSIYPALVLALNCGMRDSEIRSLTWSQIDWQKKILTVGKSKTDAGTGRTIPLDGTLLDTLVDHTRWYTMRFGETRPEWFVFPGGGRSPKDPKVPITSLKTAWDMVREKAGVAGRWHDNRHTLITELAESGAGDETIMEIAGHVSRQMLSRYSHIRTEAKRRALEEVQRNREAARERLKKARQQEAAKAELPVSTMTQ